MKNPTVSYLLKGVALLLAISLNTIEGKAADVDTTLMFPNATLREYQATKLRDLVNARASNYAKVTYASEVHSVAEAALTQESTNTVIDIDTNPNSYNITTECEKIYNLAFAYMIELDEDYLAKATEMLLDWAAVNVPISNRNIHETVYTPAIEGYSIIRNMISEEDRTTIDAWVKKRLDVFLDDSVRDNNWGTALLHQRLLYSYCIGDTETAEEVIETYDNWVHINLYPNGTTEDLLARDAFAYHAYDLLFFAKYGYVLGMYNGFETTDELYTRDVRWGASIKKSVDFFLPFMLNSDKYTHVEFENTEWSGDYTRSDYGKTFNPAGATYPFDELYIFDNEGLSGFLTKYRSGSVYQDWRLFLASLRWSYPES